MDVAGVDPVLKPCTVGGPGGIDLRDDPVLEPVREGRRDRGQGLDAGVWGSGETGPRWAWVARSTEDLLVHRSKDLQLLAWHVEASCWCEGLPGLLRGLKRLQGLLEHYWDLLHPSLQEVEARFQRIQWLDARITEALRAGGAPAPSGLMLQDLRVALARLHETLEACFGRNDAPCLEELEALLESWGTPGLTPPTDPGPGVPVGSEAGTVGAAGRAAAVAQLREGAAWFRTHEPHSPLGALVARAVRWADLPLEGWLAEVVREPGVLAQVRDLLGLEG